MLGLFWNARGKLSLSEVGTDPAVAFGGPLIEAMGRIGGAEARIALAVIETMDDGELGLRAGEILAALPEQPDQVLPAWIGQLGEAVVTDAAVMYEGVFDDARTVFLEASHPDGETHAIGVLIDNNLGGMAKDILFAESIDLVRDVVREHPSADGDIKLERLAPGVAAGRIHAAIELTDMTWDPPVSDDYADHRALALRRADEVTGCVVPAEPAEIPAAARERLIEEFLGSLEGAGFAPNTEEAYAVSLAINFCADYVDGRPLRWSPAVVELFMADCDSSPPSRRRSTPGCGLRGGSQTCRSGRLPPPARRSRSGTRRWCAAAPTRRPPVRRNSSWPRPRQRGSISRTRTR